MTTFKEVFQKEKARLWRMGHMAIFASTIVFGVLYIAQINSATAKGYELRELELAIEDLETDVSKQASEIARLQSVSRIAKSVRMLELMPANTISYIEELAPTVAFK
jgi:cell division protein FtsL